MQIRRAEAQEHGTLSAIAMEAKSHWAYSPEQLEAWRDDLTLDAAYVRSASSYVMEAEGQILGFYSLMRSRVHWQLEHLWVLPDHMGHGIGRALLQHAAALAAGKGADAIAIDADPNAESFLPGLRRHAHGHGCSTH